MKLGELKDRLGGIWEGMPVKVRIQYTICGTQYVAEASPNAVAIVNRQDGGDTYLVIEQRLPTPGASGREE